MKLNEVTKRRLPTNPVGIYRIKNLVTGRVYVGSSSNIYRRMIMHRRDLVNDCHDNGHLQNSFNKHGIDNFDYTVLETVKLEDLTVREQYWLDRYTDVYNIREICESNQGIRRGPHSAEQRKKQSVAMKGKMPSNFDDMLKKRWRKIGEYEDGKLIREYNSCAEAGRVLGVDYRLIHNILKGKVKRMKKFPNKTWKYVG